MGSYLGSGSHWWSWGLGVALIIFWALVIWAVVALVSWAHRGRSGPGGPRGPGGPGTPPGPAGPEDPHRRATPEEDPARQYATGEIDADEYHRRRNTVRSQCFAGTGSRS
jgi:uncharacterized membrane protein